MKEQTLESYVIEQIDKCIEDTKERGASFCAVFHFDENTIETRDKMVLHYVYAGYHVAVPHEGCIVIHGWISNVKF